MKNIFYSFTLKKLRTENDKFFSYFRKTLEAFNCLPQPNQNTHPRADTNMKINWPVFYFCYKKIYIYNCHGKKIK